MSAMIAARGPLPAAYQLLRSKETPQSNTIGQSRTPSPESNEQQRDSLLSPPLRRYSEAPSDFQGGRRKEGPHERVDNVGALAIAVPFMLIALGELTVPSGLAGVLASTTPIFVALFSPVLGYNTRINRRQGAGLIVGLIGVALVVGAHFVGSLGQLLGALAVLGAAASGGLSSFVVALQYKDKGIPASTTSFFSLSVGALLTLPVALITAPHELPGTRAVLAVIVLGLLCTALAFMLYYSLIDQIGEERASLATYLTLVFALFYGVLLLGESLTVAAVIGLVLIIVGAEITLRGAGNRHSGGDLRTQHRVHPPFH
jgi:drug/metabolite transporter (DMT)-like permease